jgi:hypothetical protein
VQVASLVVGATFLLIGIAGFTPGITTDYDQLTGAGHHSGAMLFGTFQVSILHNVVHLVFGLIGLVAARAAISAGRYLLVGGLIYLALWVYGLIIDNNSSANIVPLNAADDWLHFGIGLGMIVLGVLLTRGLS